MSAPRFIPILTYHQIAPEPAKDTAFRSLCVSPERFRQQMSWLRRCGFQGLCMRDLMPYIRGEKQGRVVGITFDDGYQNNITHALDVLVQHRFSATVYAVSALPSGSNAWDAHLGIPPSQLMSQEDLITWHQSGQEVGSHTEHHVHLTQCTTADAQSEIERSKRTLESLLQAPVNQFCYPYGEFNDEIAHLVQAAGYEGATTTQRSRVKVGGVGGSPDVFSLPRVPIVRSTLWPQFLLKTLTAYEDRRGS
jgi:peptidoglycan/xylan/chitin deacetylase (PgdA/CDA1 family)